jgi:hypothetical protein
LIALCATRERRWVAQHGDLGYRRALKALPDTLPEITDHPGAGFSRDDAGGGLRTEMEVSRCYDR